MVAGILEKSKRLRKAVLFVGIQKTPKCRPGNPSRNFVPATSFAAWTPKHADRGVRYASPVTIAIVPAGNAGLDFPALGANSYYGCLVNKTLFLLCELP